MMDKDIQSVLQEALEAKIPAEGIMLWPTVKASLDVKKISPLRGQEMKAANPAHFRRIVFVSCIVVALLALVFSTPQGRAFAHSVIRFFTPAQATSFPLPLQPGPDETNIQDSDKTNAPMFFSSMVAAEAAVGFSAHELAASPEGYVFRDIEANPASGIIVAHYDAVGGGGELVFSQSLSGFPSNAWSEVPPYAIEKVNVGGDEGEYAQGMFVVYPNSNSATWEPDAPVFRLRWKDGECWYSLEKMGDTYPTEWLDKQAMITLAESLAR